MSQWHSYTFSYIFLYCENIKKWIRNFGFCHKFAITTVIVHCMHNGCTNILNTIMYKSFFYDLRFAKNYIFFKWYFCTFIRTVATIYTVSFCIWIYFVGLCCTKLGLVTCCRNCKIKESKKKTYVDELFMLATIMNNVNQAEVLWSECKNPMCKALFPFVILSFFI